jgi:hypothetical protein
MENESYFNNLGLKQQVRAPNWAAIRFHSLKSKGCSTKYMGNQKKKKWYNGAQIPKNMMKLPLQATYRKEITYRDTNTLIKYFSEKFKLS